MSDTLTSPIQIVALVAVAGLIYVIIRLITKGKLRAEYSIIWAVLCFVLFFFTAYRGALDHLADFFGVFYAPSLIFIIFFFLIFIFLIHLSVVASKHQDAIKKLTQENALLKDQLRKKSKE